VVIEDESHDARDAIRMETIVAPPRFSGGGGSGDFGTRVFSCRGALPPITRMPTGQSATSATPARPPTVHLRHPRQRRRSITEAATSSMDASRITIFLCHPVLSVHGRVTRPSTTRTM
jgi:hypothetical protein